MLPFSFPATNATSPFAAMKSSHPCLRVPDRQSALDWYVRVFDFRVVKEWSGPNGIELAYLAAPGDNASLIEIIGGNATDMEPHCQPISGRPLDLAAITILHSRFQVTSAHLRRCVSGG